MVECNLLQRRSSLVGLCACLSMLWCSCLLAEDARHQELRDLRDSVMQAYESRDLDALLKYVHPDVIVTWQNGQQNHGVSELKEFYRVMMQGDKPIVQDVKSKLAVHQLATLHEPNTAVACGSLDDHFKLSSGMDFELSSQWTATLVKGDEGWKIASFHVSGNLFDNPLLAAAKRSLMLVGAISAVVGLLVGWGVSRLRTSPSH